VIDIGLPDMDGYELARKLREVPETRDSRLIAVTGYGTKADTYLFEEAGFDHYFPKPTNIEELSRALHWDAASQEAVSWFATLCGLKAGDFKFQICPG
jgi:CheY-like chemotaxis protein